MNTVRKLMKEAWLSHQLVQLEKALNKAKEVNKDGVLNKVIDACENRIELLKTQESV